MDAWRYVLSSLRHYRRIHVAVALGVAVATAVLAGALLVGDSMRGSLRDLTLQRLGRIDSVIMAGHPFREALAGELAADAEFQKQFAAAVPVLLLNGSLQAGSGQDAQRATGISIVGCTPEFWSLGEGGPAKPLAGDEIAVTEPIARELSLKPGDEVLLRIPVATAIPADSTLGKKSGTALSRRFKVAAVLPVEGLARFSVVPSQQLPRNAFLPIGALQQLLEQPGKANAILVAARDDQISGDEPRNVLERALKPTLADYGLKFEHLDSPTNCFQISADQLVLADEVVRAAEKAFPGGAQPVVTYLANTIAVGEGSAQRTIPYSTITGIDSKPQHGPLFDDMGRPIALDDDEIVLNRWSANRLPPPTQS
jgi:hypothetical protein